MGNQAPQVRSGPGTPPALKYDESGKPIEYKFSPYTGRPLTGEQPGRAQPVTGYNLNDLKTQEARDAAMRGQARTLMTEQGRPLPFKYDPYTGLPGPGQPPSWWQKQQQQAQQPPPIPITPAPPRPQVAPAPSVGTTACQRFPNLC
jgi:hypothetical protein